MNKYKNKKVTLDGITFDSRAEANRYFNLRILERAGEIQDLKLQPDFQITDGFCWNGKKYRARKYTADFMYKIGRLVYVEEFKSKYLAKNDASYSLRKHLFLQRYRDDYIFIETIY